MANNIVDEPEEWRPIPGYPGYEASSLGRIRSLDRWSAQGLRKGRVLAPSRAGPYEHVHFAPGGSVKVHIAVCLAFHGKKPSPKHEVAHWDNDGSNNRKDNLRWASSAENKGDQIRHGTRLRGTRHGMATLSDEDVIEIRRLAASGMPGIEISEAFGIKAAQVSRIRNRRRWTHI